MSDSKLLATAFSLLDQPVVLAKKERIAYMNQAAIKLAAKDMTGKPLSLLIPSHILNTQADSFIASAFMGTKSCTVKLSSCDGYKVFAMSCGAPEVESNDMLHTELRSTLANVKFAASCISVLAENDNNEKLSEYVCSLNRSYYRMKHAVDNVTALSALSKGTMPFRPEPIDISELCRSTIAVVMSMTSESGIKISFHSEDSIKIIADRDLVQHLLLNLLSNSLIHCAKDGRISVSLLRTDQNLILSVDDNGSGIEQPELAYAFDRFRHEVNLTQVQGTGMGLALVRGIAELHKGAVIIESRGENMGTSVRVMLSFDVPASKYFSAPEPDYQTGSLRAILTELSDCLPVECFSEKLED